MTSPQAKPFLSQARSWLFSAICFVLPMKASYIYTLSALLLLVWIADGGLRAKFEAILRSKLCLAFIAYFGVYVLAMLWTEDTTSGWNMVGRHVPFLLFLLYWSSAEPGYRERYVSALLAGLCVCALLAYYNWIQLHWFPDWPRGVKVFKDPDDTAPFVDRILYTPILALGAYFSLRRAVFATSMTARMLPALIAAFLVFNLFFSGGRAGTVMFLALCVALAFERIKARGKALLLCVLVLPLLLVTAYRTQSYFAERVDFAVRDIKVFPENPNTSVGQRLVFWATSIRLFADHPLGGVGSGDYEKEYNQLKSQYWDTTPESHNPHNQFLMTAATTGLLGLAALFCIFYFAASGSDFRTRTMLLGFAVVCLFESYLWRSNTSLAFAAVLAALAAGKTPESKS
ncbi:O-antigen ligase family protein [Noviherbaspirillum massiliense]|uniref:O-antigen ligase family protein n=1 Tax=Noviherbaspirillum massiliense TaxID=1465823 RepID=UPI00036E2426|nr:O-antigen ligase family protein [Noviherbaspirillum massiliense]